MQLEKLGLMVLWLDVQHTISTSYKQKFPLFGCLISQRESFLLSKTRICFSIKRKKKIILIAYVVRWKRIHCFISIEIYCWFNLLIVAYINWYTVARVTIGDNLNSPWHILGHVDAAMYGVPNSGLTRRQVHLQNLWLSMDASALIFRVNLSQYSKFTIFFNYLFFIWLRY